MRLAAILTLVATLAVHVYAVVAWSAREPHMDENEYLHAGWLMANGGRLYDTFFEHHSPLFFQTLSWLAPRGERVPVRPYFVSARTLCGVFGLIALAAYAAMLWPIGAEAAAIGVALLVGTGPLWVRSFLEVRAETFAIAFFCVGTHLAIRWRGVAGGAGVGLIAISALWMPKWPLACVAIALTWLVRSDRRIAGALAATLVTALGFLAIRLIVPFDQWWFFNYEANVALTRAVLTPWVINAFFQGGAPFVYVPWAFHPAFVIACALLVLASLRVERSVWRALPLLLFVAAFLEVRFVYPWPAIWNHYYLMWSIAAAGIIGATPSAIALLLRNMKIRPRLASTLAGIITVVALVLAAVQVFVAFPERSASTYWVAEGYLRNHLQPGEIVWLEPSRHPITVRDAHYYWFSVNQMVSAAQELRKTPRGRRFLPAPNEFPVCTVPENLRYTLDPRRVMMQGASECMQRLVDSGRARRTVFFDVYEVGLLKSAPESSTPKGN
jgi:hypothetical protein